MLKQNHSNQHGWLIHLNFLRMERWRKSRRPYSRLGLCQAIGQR